jgi:hypothetical protein
MAQIKFRRDLLLKFGRKEFTSTMANANKDWQRNADTQKMSPEVERKSVLIC